MKKYHHLIGKKVSCVIDEEPMYPSSPNAPAVVSTFRVDVVVGLFSRVSVDGRRREEFAIMESGQRVEIPLLFFDEVYQPDKPKSSRKRRAREPFSA